MSVLASVDSGSGEEDCRQEYVISGRCLTESGEEMPCSFLDVALAEMRVLGPETLKRGTVLFCFLEGVGLVLARVMGESVQGGWLLKPIIPADRRGRILDRLEWHRERDRERAEQRQARRIVPLNRRVVVQIGERLAFKGTVQNLSTMGAAIALNPACRPYVGCPVRVGRRDAVVVRLTTDGIAVRFNVGLAADFFDETIVL